MKGKECFFGAGADASTGNRSMYAAGGSAALWYASAVANVVPVPFLRVRWVSILWSFSYGACAVAR